MCLLCCVHCFAVQKSKIAVPGGLFTMGMLSRMLVLERWAYFFPGFLISRQLYFIELAVGTGFERALLPPNSLVAE